MTVRDDLKARREARRRRELVRSLVARGVPVVWLEELKRHVVPVAFFTSRPGAA